MILEYRGLAKLRSTYTDKLPEMINPDTGRVHTSYHQAGAATGRLSSSDPNLQNIPIRSEDGRRIRTRLRRAAGPQAGGLRLLADRAADHGPPVRGPGACCAPSNPAPTCTARPRPKCSASTLDEVTANERRAAKAINFGLMYGMSAFGLAKQLGIARGEAQDYIAPVLQPLSRACATSWSAPAQQAREQGYVETVFGRRLYLDDIHARNQGLRAGAERAAINAPMQGTAADIIKRAMVDIDGWLAPHRDRQALMIMQVHDELVFEVDEGFLRPCWNEVPARMAAAAQLRVPLVVDTGRGRQLGPGALRPISLVAGCKRKACQSVPSRRIWE